MSGQDDDTERDHEPSQRKLDEARKNGDVPRSMELTTAAVYAGLVLALLIAGLAWQDYRREARLSACSVLALVAVIAPLLVLFGLKHGLVGSLTERLQRDPAVREIIPLGGTRLWAVDGRAPDLRAAHCLPHVSAFADSTISLPHTIRPSTI